MLYETPPSNKHREHLVLCYKQDTLSYSFFSTWVFNTWTTNTCRKQKVTKAKKRNYFHKSAATVFLFFTERIHSMAVEGTHTGHCSWILKKLVEGSPSIPVSDRKCSQIDCISSSNIWPSLQLSVYLVISVLMRRLPKTLPSSIVPHKTDGRDSEFWSLFPGMPQTRPKPIKSTASFNII